MKWRCQFQHNQILTVLMFVEEKEVKCWQVCINATMTAILVLSMCFRYGRTFQSATYFWLQLFWELPLAIISNQFYYTNLVHLPLVNFKGNDLTHKFIVLVRKFINLLWSEEVFSNFFFVCLLKLKASCFCCTMLFWMNAAFKTEFQVEENMFNALPTNGNEHW